MNFKRVAWHVLISSGGVLKTLEEPEYAVLESNPIDKNYYGSNWMYEYEKTIEAMKLMQAHGIDYDAMGEPHQDRSYHFVDTYATNQYECNHMWGILKTGGKEFYWGVETSDLSFGELVTTMTNLASLGIQVQFEELKFASALSALQSRLDKFEAYLQKAGEKYNGYRPTDHFYSFCQLGKSYD